MVYIFLPAAVIMSLALIYVYIIAPIYLSLRSVPVQQSEAKEVIPAQQEVEILQAKPTAETWVKHLQEDRTVKPLMAMLIVAGYTKSEARSLLKGDNTALGKLYDELFEQAEKKRIVPASVNGKQGELQL